MPDASEIIQQLVATFAKDAQIDRLVYELYGLTDPLRYRRSMPSGGSHDQAA